MFYLLHRRVFVFHLPGIEIDHGIVHRVLQSSFAFGGKFLNEILELLELSLRNIHHSVPQYNEQLYIKLLYKTSLHFRNNSACIPTYSSSVAYHSSRTSSHAQPAPPTALAISSQTVVAIDQPLSKATQNNGNSRKALSQPLIFTNSVGRQQVWVGSGCSRPCRRVLFIVIWTPTCITPPPPKKHAVAAAVTVTLFLFTANFPLLKAHPKEGFDKKKIDSLFLEAAVGVDAEAGRQGVAQRLHEHGPLLPRHDPHRLQCSSVGQSISRSVGRSISESGATEPNQTNPDQPNPNPTKRHQTEPQNRNQTMPFRR